MHGPTQEVLTQSGGGVDLAGMEGAVSGLRVDLGGQISAKPGQ